jgi:putative ABC transport system permease protein
MMRLRRFFRRARRVAESARDIQFHIETETDDNIARGMPPEEALGAARRKFGNTTLVREEIHRMNGMGFLETIWQDLRYSLRGLRKNPTFTFTAVVTLALGIGGNTAIFTLIRGVLLKPLEYRDPDRLVYFSIDNPRRNLQDLSFGLTQCEEMRAAAKSFTALGAYGRPENIMLSRSGEPEALKGARVSADFLDILGIQPVLGRSFLPEEDKRGGPQVAMISTELWQRRFGSDPQVVGKAATLNATPYTIIGVLPKSFVFPFAGVDVWVTRPSEWSLMAPRYWDGPLLNGFARLKRGVSLEQARAEMKVLQQQYAVAHPSLMSPDRGEIMRVVWLKDHFVADVRPMLWTLFGAVGFVLLIACANVASLLLARSTSRSREFAVRAALGAGRGRLIRQLLAESLMLAVAGGVLGVLLANWSLRAVTHIGPLNLPRASEVRPDGIVLAFSVLVSIVAGVLFGLFPSLKSSRPDLADELRESGAAAGRGLSGRRGVFGLSARGLLVVGQIALSIVLLIGAALLMQSFVRLHRVDPGFQPANLLTAKIALPPARYDTDRKKSAFFRELLPHLEHLPGVSGAAMAMSLPTTTWIRTNILEVEGKPPLEPSDASSYGVWQSITPGYFHTLGIRLKRGREFTARDNTTGAPPVMMVNERLTRILWPHYSSGENPIGRHVKEAYDKSIGWMEVVGVVADIHEAGLANAAVPEFYLPCVVHPPQTAYLVVRTAGDPLRLAGAIRLRVLAIDRDQPISDVKTMEAVLTANFGQRRLAMLLLGSFAGVALLLAVVGLYGVIAYSIAQRTQEVGIRRALGAQQGDILRLVLRQGLALSLAGVTIGVAGAFALTRVMKNLLFHVTATDPATFAGIAVVFIIVALAASYIPARRAARIDPMAALRIG